MRNGTRRDLLMMLVLTFITGGLYYFYWAYKPLVLFQIGTQAVLMLFLSPPNNAVAISVTKFQAAQAKAR